MGIHGLWRLLEPAGRDVTLESLENKVLAIDVSLWLYQAQQGSAYAGEAANAPNSHLITLFHRISKLLFYRVKPVFVFDGVAPGLKKKTIFARKQKKQVALDRAEEMKQQLLLSLAKSGVVDPTYIKIQADKASASPSPKKGTPKKSNATEDEDLYKLPPLPKSVATDKEDVHSEESSPSDEDDYMISYYKEEESSNASGKQGHGAKGKVQGGWKKWNTWVDPHEVDVQSESFKTLPVEVRREILTDLKEARKESSWGRLHRMPKDLGNFSNFQMTRLLHRRRVQEVLEEVEEEFASNEVRGASLGELEAILVEKGVAVEVQASQRIASDENKGYILLSGLKDQNKVEEMGDEKKAHPSKLASVKEEPEDPSEDVKEEDLKMFSSDGRKSEFTAVEEGKSKWTFDEDVKHEADDGVASQPTLKEEEMLSSNSIVKQFLMSVTETSNVERNVCESGEFESMTNALDEESCSNDLSQGEILAIIKNQATNEESTNAQKVDLKYAKGSNPVLPRVQPNRAEEDVDEVIEVFTSEDEENSLTQEQMMKIICDQKGSSADNEVVKVVDTPKKHLDVAKISHEENSDLTQEQMMKIICDQKGSSADNEVVKVVDTPKKHLDIAKISHEENSDLTQEQMMKIICDQQGSSADNEVVKVVDTPKKHLDIAKISHEENSDLTQEQMMKIICDQKGSSADNEVVKVVDTPKKHLDIAKISHEENSELTQEQMMKIICDQQGSSADNEVVKVVDTPKKHLDIAKISHEENSELTQEQIMKIICDQQGSSADNEVVKVVGTLKKHLDIAKISHEENSDLTQEQIMKIICDQQGSSADIEVVKVVDTPMKHLDIAKISHEENSDLTQEQLMKIICDRKGSSADIEVVKVVDTPKKDFDIAKLPEAQEKIISNPMTPAGTDDEVIIENVSRDSESDGSDFLEVEDFSEQSRPSSEKCHVNTPEIRKKVDTSKSDESSKKTTVDKKLEVVIDLTGDSEVADDIFADIFHDENPKKCIESKTRTFPNKDTVNTTVVDNAEKEGEADKPNNFDGGVEYIEETSASEPEDVTNEEQEKAAKEPGKKIEKPSPSVEVVELTAEERQQLTLELRKKELEGKAGVTRRALLESQELLGLFGVPWIVAPYEAEAQCAFLESASPNSSSAASFSRSLVQGTVTEDSDIWAFGATNVYRHVFDRRRTRVRVYSKDEVKRRLGIDRIRMVQIALLTGSDYTIGIPGIGTVTALEILAAFPGDNEPQHYGPDPEVEAALSGLQHFADWWKRVEKNEKEGTPVGHLYYDPPEAVAKTLRRRLCSCLKAADLKQMGGSLLPAGFPSKAVVQAYLKPSVDDCTDSFTWLKPDEAALRSYARLHFGWTEERIDSVLRPLFTRLKLSDCVDRKQTSLHSYFSRINVGSNVVDVEGSNLGARTKKALERIAGKCEEELSSPPKKKGRVAKKAAENEAQEPEAAFEELSSPPKEKGRVANKAVEDEAQDLEAAFEEERILNEDDFERRETTGKLQLLRQKFAKELAKTRKPRATKSSVSNVAGSSSKSTSIRNRVSSSNKESVVETGFASSLYSNAKIPQREKDDASALQSKLKAIEVMRKSSIGLGKRVAPKKSNLGRGKKLKRQEVCLSESSDSN